MQSIFFHTTKTAHGWLRPWPLSHWILPTVLSWSSWQMLFTSITKPNQLLIGSRYKQHSAFLAWAHRIPWFFAHHRSYFHHLSNKRNAGALKMGQVELVWVITCWEKLYGIPGIHSQALRNMSPKMPTTSLVLTRSTLGGFRLCRLNKKKHQDKPSCKSSSLH